MLETAVWHLEYLLSWMGLSTHPPPPHRNQHVAGYFKDKERFSTLSSLERGTHYSMAVDAKITENKKRKHRSLVLHRAVGLCALCREIWDFPLLGLFFFS